MPYPDLQALPETRAQWLFVAHAAAGLLLIADAKDFGFIAGGPEIDRSASRGQRASGRRT